MALEAERGARRPDPAGAEGAGQGIAGGRVRAAALRPQGPRRAEALPPDRLAGNAREALAFIAEQAEGAAQGRASAAWPPAATAGSPTSALIEIVNDDMPFLVDSVLGELQARGLAVRLLLHPIFKTRRDKAGRLQDIAGAGDASWSDGHQESYIAVHLPGAVRRRRRAISPPRSRPSCRRCASSSPTGSRCCERLEAAVAAAGDGAGQRAAATCWPSRRPSWNGSEQDNFTFLGSREFELAGDAETGDLVAVEGSGLGVLRDASVQVLRRGTELVAMTPEVRRFFFEPAPLIITKANVIARVHRRAHMDYIGVKTYRADGSAQRRDPLRRPVHVAGLRAPARPDPVPAPQGRHACSRPPAIRPPATTARRCSTFSSTFPRDELFQIGIEQLQEWTEGILDLETRPRVRVFARIDRFDRFVSVLVYVPRDRYATQVRERIGALLADAYNGRIAAFYPYFPEGPLVRVQFIVGRYGGETPQVDVAELERKIADIVRTWEDRLADAIAAQGRRDARGAARQVRQRPSRPDTRRPSRPERALRGHRAHRAARARSARRHRFPSRARRAAEPHPCRRLFAGRADHALRARAGAGEPGLLGHRRALLSHPAALCRRRARRDAARHGAGDERRRRHRAGAARQAARRLLPGRACAARPTTTASTA